MTKNTAQTLLIHADDPIIAALLGALLGEDAMIAFPERGETLEAATRRLTPHAVLADISASPPGSEVAQRLVGTATQMIFFGSADECDRIRSTGKLCFVLPTESERLREHVRALIAAAGR